KLSSEVRRLETANRSSHCQRVTSAGCAALDSQLPERGYVPGCVVEYLRMTPACGASYLAFAAAACAMRATDGVLMVVDVQHNVYPPALDSLGIDLEKVIFVRPKSHTDAIWSIDQALRTPAVAAVVAEIERIDDRTARRLQLAAEQADGLALLIRSAAARQQPSWAEVQWLVHSLATSGNTTSVAVEPTVDEYAYRSRRNRQLQVQLARVRGGRTGTITRLEIDALTGQLQAITPSLRERNRHESALPASQRSANREAASSQANPLHMAAELAHTTRPSDRTAAG
ncbi:MAG: hypothetical protein KDB22_04485, partial [Planctomycetales bacterium]|nr:hypothetical protein [Planctomycetales bacterium]